MYSPEKSKEIEPIATEKYKRLEICNTHLPFSKFQGQAPPPAFLDELWKYSSTVFIYLFFCIYVWGPRCCCSLQRLECAKNINFRSHLLTSKHLTTLFLLFWGNQILVFAQRFCVFHRDRRHLSTPFWIWHFKPEKFSLNRVTGACAQLISKFDWLID